MDFTVWMNKRGLAGGKKWALWHVEFFHTQGSIAIKPFIIPSSSHSSVYLGPPVKMFPGGSVWPYHLEKRTCLFVYGVRAAEAHFPAWNTLSGLLWLWLGTRSSLQGQSSFMGLLFPVKIYPGDRSSRNFQCLSNQLWQRESLGIGFCIPPQGS